MKKVAIITGASRGIGKCLAIGLAKGGYSVALIARNKEVLDQVSDEIKSVCHFQEKPLVIAYDVSDVNACKNCVEAVIDHYGRIDILVNSAGILVDGSWEVEPERFKEQININLVGAFNMIHAVVPIMKSYASGYIFNIASRRGKIAMPSEGAYSASKFGLVGLNEALYKELASSGIKVTAICPGWVNTDMAQGSTLEAGQMISTDDILSTVLYILSLSSAASVKEILIEPSSNIS